MRNKRPIARKDHDSPFHHHHSERRRSASVRTNSFGNSRRKEAALESPPEAAFCLVWRKKFSPNFNEKADNIV